MAKASPQDTDAATVSLGTVIIDAAPDKVYRKLSRAREWEGWLNVARLIHTAQPQALETDNTFCYIGRLAPGFIDAFVQDAEPHKVLNWNEKALFGLIRGGSRWQLRREGGRVRGIWLRRPKTLVTLDQEVTVQTLVSAEVDLLELHCAHKRLHVQLHRAKLRFKKS